MATELNLVKKDKNQEIVIALAGNPNCGKTMIFNNLTGARQQVGNWPGVTVEKKEGFLLLSSSKIRVVDLPGTYSLGAYSEDEKVASKYIISGQPDVIINVVDASNIERNLYLTTQLLESGSNVVMALNMLDEAEKCQIHIDIPELASGLGIPVIPTIATRNIGMRELVDIALKQAVNPPTPLRIDYGPQIEAELLVLEALINRMPDLINGISPRFAAIKLLEGDEGIISIIQSRGASARPILEARNACQERLQNLYEGELDSVIVESRYQYIAKIVNRAVSKTEIREGSTVSEKIDRVVLNRYLGIPIFLLIMYGMFQFTFSLASPLTGLIEQFFTWLGTATVAYLSSPLLSSLVEDALIGGIGSVLVFVPNIFLLFLFISVLEDSGYMARGAYIIDRFMHSLGLHGKSFIPLIVGFGCNVPAVMATRTLENKSDRLITMLIVPLMSCTARLPVYILFVGAFSLLIRD